MFGLHFQIKPFWPPGLDYSADLWVLSKSGSVWLSDERPRKWKAKKNETVIEHQNNDEIVSMKFRNNVEVQTDGLMDGG